MICNRCKKSNFGICSLGYCKTDAQLRTENYDCFEERIYNIKTGLYNPDNYTYSPYGEEISYNNSRLHDNMRKSERNLRKN